MSMQSEKVQTGATRNRTAVFVQYRNEKKLYRERRRDSSSKKEDSKHLLGPDSIEMDDVETGRRDKLPPDWMMSVDDVNYDIATIKQKLGELATLHKQHLLPQISEDERGDDEQKVEILTEYVTKMFQNARIKASRIGASTKNASNEDEDMRRNIQSSLGTQLQELSVTFRKQQTDYLKKLRARAGKGQGVEINEGDDGTVDVSFSKAQVAEVDYQVDIVATREKEIRQIAKSINDLAAIFRDLATLVIEQGTILDRIDYNVEHVRKDVEDAVGELHGAEKAQKGQRNKLCMLLLCIGILIAVIIIIFKIIL